MDDLSIMQRVGIAFTELDKLPEYYQYLLFVAVTASFGIRGADKLMKMALNLVPSSNSPQSNN